MQSISIFFPCYNDSKTIKKLVEDAIKTVHKLTKNYEIIVIDDASVDNSREVLEKLAKKYRRLRLIYHEQNLGYGGAIKSGIKAAKKELVFYTDGDGQYDVNELPLLVNLMTKDVDFINGIKMVRRDPTYRILLGNIYSLMARWLFWLPTYDIDCDYRLMRKQLIKKLDLKCNSGSICVELVKKSHRAGAKFRQVSIHHFNRNYGQSQFFRPERLLQTLFELSGLWLRLMIFDKIFK